MENIAKAGFSDVIKVVVGPGAETLKTLEPTPPFDFIFIDADKPSNAIYFTEAKRLVKQGGVIVSNTDTTELFRGMRAKSNAHPVDRG